MSAARYARRVHLTLVRDASVTLDSRTIATPLDSAVLARKIIADDPREHMIAIYVDTKHKPIAVHVVAVGSCDQTMCGAREVFGPAMLCNASGIVLAHNHPSGDPTPSIQDRMSTDKLRTIGEHIGIAILDHVVIGHEKFFAFSEMREREFPMGAGL